MVIETFGLTKTYGYGQGGCRDVNIAVAPGQVFGLLGANGAGKSTLVKTLVGLLHPTSGRALVLGSPLGDKNSRKKIGFLPEQFRFHDWLTGREVLYYHGRLYGMEEKVIASRIPEVLETLGLRGAGGKRVGSYSKGMQQRLGIACALLNRPRLVFLDEPTSALDPLGRREVRNIIQRLKEEGTTVFLNSHLLSEVEMVCDQVAIIDKGQVVAHGTLKELLERKVMVKVELDNITSRLREAIAGIGAVREIRGNNLTLEVDSREKIPCLAQLIVEEGGKIYNLQCHHHSLEDLFIQMVENGTKEERACGS